MCEELIVKVHTHTLAVGPINGCLIDIKLILTLHILSTEQVIASDHDAAYAYVGNRVEVSNVAVSWEDH